MTSPKLKVLLINDYGSPTGGAEIFVFRFRKYLDEQGINTKIFTSNAVEYKKEIDYTCLGTTSSFRTLLQSCNPLAYFALQKALRQFRPHIIHLNVYLTQISPAILPLLKNYKTIYQAHWFRPICPLSTKRLPSGSECTTSPGWGCYTQKCLPIHDAIPITLQAKLQSRYQKNFTTTIVSNQRLKTALENNQFSDVRLLYNGVPYHSRKRELSQKQNIVFAGRLVHQKGIDLLISAFAKIHRQFSNSRLIIAGDGPEKSKLLKQVLELNLQSKVSFLGHISQEEMEDCFITAWAQVIPSRFFEGFALSAAESMMRGTPTIVSQECGISELIEHNKNAFIMKHIDDLAQILSKLLSSKYLAETVGDAGKKTAVDYFQEETYFANIVKIYQQLKPNY